MQRRAIAVRGIVQGVGFRPFVHALAGRLGLGGFVRNGPGRVLIEVEGEAGALDEFLRRLTADAPPLAHIDAVSWADAAPRGEGAFRIDASDAGGGDDVFISPDVATCPACLAELFDPADRRYLYPFLNCTDCGPRLTLITGAPYDRGRTTMASFAMCPACRAEYDDPANRRFHAQPTACPACGPRLQLIGPHGEPLAADDPLARFADALRGGAIGAIKGLGGYHLACDPRAAAELRRRKHRDERPFAVMAADLAAALALGEVSPAERDLLLSPRRPIVLLRRRADATAAAVAPGHPRLGVMLPYTPLHHLLMRQLPGPVVMTSGNRSDEPIAYDDGDAVARLAGIADLFLTHDRPIHVRCDDSVTRLVEGEELPVRRSRGYAPRPIALPLECPAPALAVGGQLKATFALGRGRHALLSHHLGDLDHLDASRAFVRDVALYEQLFAVAPRLIAHDLHPDYASTRYALRRADAEGLRLLAVQHHHAHMASCMAEHGLAGPVIGVTFDGAGHGPDGAVWGGEFLVGGYRSFRRAAHLRYVGLPGGDRAVKEPWRVALAHLLDAGADLGPLGRRVPAAEVRTVTQMLRRRVNTPWASSAGRLFDAVASLAGLRDRVSYEGQAAVELEWLAEEEGAAGAAYPFDILASARDDQPLVVDTRPLIRAVAADAGAASIARRFHATLAEIVAAVCGRLRRATGVGEVVLSGGVFLNAVLTREVIARLRAAGLRPYRHRLVPPGDGGLSLGQLAVAAAWLTGGEDVPRGPR